MAAFPSWATAATTGRTVQEAIGVTRDRERHREGQRENRDWPVYYAYGLKSQDSPTFLQIEGPNGPATRFTANGEPEPVTMLDVVRLAMRPDFHRYPRASQIWYALTHSGIEGGTA